MAARRTKKIEGLDDSEVADLRRQLADGRRPRVQLSGPQFPPGASGTISRIGDPATAGTDYITVRTKVNGVIDELAFAPAELSLRPRASSAATRKAANVGSALGAGAASSVGVARQPRQRLTPPTSSAAATSPVASAGSPVSPASVSTASATASAPTSKASEAVDRPVKAADRPARSADRPAKAADPAAVDRADKEADPARSPARRRKVAAPPKVSVTVSSSGASWTVSATRGPKAIVRSVAVPPGAITALAELLDQPALIEAVAEINETALAEAQDRAEQLRAELAQLEAVLATHRTPR